MREYGDYSGVDEFKRGALRELVNEGFDIRLALDDDRRTTRCTSAKVCLHLHPLRLLPLIRSAVAEVQHLECFAPARRPEPMLAGIPTPS